MRKASPGFLELSMSICTVVGLEIIYRNLDDVVAKQFRSFPPVDHNSAGATGVAQKVFQPPQITLLHRGIKLYFHGNSPKASFDDQIHLGLIDGPVIGKLQLGRHSGLESSDDLLAHETFEGEAGDRMQQQPIQVGDLEKIVQQTLIPEKALLRLLHLF